MIKPSNSAGQLRWFLLLGTVFLITLITFFVAYLTEQAALSTAKQRMENTLTFQLATLQASMDKYAILSALTARRPDVIEALNSNNPRKILPEPNQLATTFAGLSGANDIWIVNSKGKVFVSNQPESAPQNLFAEPYFQTALQGSLGRASSVTDAGQRLYIFASPVFSDSDVVGVVVVRVNLEFIEQVWVLLDDLMLARDNTDRILLSSVQSWRLKKFFNRESSQKKDPDLFLVDKFYGKSVNKIALRNAVEKNSGRDYLQVSRYVPLLEWQVHTMTNYQSIIAQRNTAVFIALLIMAIIVMAVMIWLSRQKRLLEKQRAQQAFSLRLERQVRDRTHELTSANQQLETEVEERRIAELTLRETQEELVQAAKLAAIGQMSTALAHEYNQPLTAIRSYADNASTFLNQENSSAATDNLQRITMLVDKMANLTSTLRNFAHKAGKEFTAIPLAAVMDELVILLSPQAKKQQVNLTLVPPQESLLVKAEHSRLSQVMTNLVTNAMDAVADMPRREVEISWRKYNNKAILCVKDSGPGIDDEVKEKMFNAFYTTKGTGDGLGLGLFIVLNIINDFKGALDVKAEKNYGAVFQITLPLADEKVVK